MIRRRTLLATPALALAARRARAADAAPAPVAQIAIDPAKRHQTMDGFGVNFNGTYYRPAQKKMVDALVDDLGVSIVRFDPYGQTDWETKNDNEDPASIDWAYFDDRYSTPAFEASWEAARHLNRRRVRLMLNVSGTVPAWMLDDKGGPLAHKTCNKAPNPVHPFTNRPSHLRREAHDEYAETVVSMALYAQKKAGVKFELFNPLNETDCYPIEGPRVDPDEVPDLLRAVIRAMDRAGLGQIPLVAADQAQSGADYFGPIVAAKDVMERMGVLSLHRYGDNQKDYDRQVATVRGSAFPATKIWLTEYGDLGDKKRTPENEWEGFCKKATRRVLQTLNVGASAALFWDAFDNYHDHDKEMTYYGLVKNERHVYTPKKRYFAAKQLYRYVRPGAQRIEAVSDRKELVVSAFRDEKARKTVIVGLKDGAPDRLEIALPGAKRGAWQLLVTTPQVDCARGGRVTARDGALTVDLPGDAVFTLVGPA